MAAPDLGDASAEPAQRRVAALEATITRDREALESAALQHQQAEQALAELPEPDQEDGSELGDRIAELRQAETEARLELRTLEERAAGLAQRAASLQRAAQEEERSQERAARQHERRLRRARIAASVAGIATAAQEAADADLAAITERRHQLRESLARRGARLAQLRTEIRELEGQVTRLNDSVNREEVARAELAWTQQRLNAALIRESTFRRADGLAHDLPRQPQIPRDRLDRLPTRMLPPYPNNRLHHQHPDLATWKPRQPIKPSE